jgi:hypothetical protein
MVEAMFITNDTNGCIYNRDGDQFNKGMFLILMTEKNAPMVNGKYHVRAIVRYVTLTQFGPWMMGSCRIGNNKYTLSGAYGSDGLLLDVDHDAFERGIDLPNDLYDAWSNGGGHNGAGNESSMMRKWAHDHIAALYDVKTPCLHAFREFAAIRNGCTNRVAYKLRLDMQYGR